MILVVLGALLVVAGLVVNARLRRPWAAWTGLAAGLVLAAIGGAQLAGNSEPSGVMVAIVTPAEGVTVAAGEPVTLEVNVDGGEVATSETDTTGGHLHLYVDGRLQAMEYTTTTTVTLEPGEHTIRVEFVDARHVSFNPEVATSITVTAS